LKLHLTICTLLIIIFSISTQSWAGTTQKQSSDFSVTPSVGVTQFILYNSNPFFSAPSRYWLETSAYFGGTGTYQDFSVRVVGMAAKTTGQDPFGTGTVATGTPTGTAIGSATASFDMDEAFVRYQNIGNLPLQATLGRQHIDIGTEFLFGDGVYDGFAASNQQAVYHNPRQGFDALRLEWDVHAIHVDSFAYWVDPTWDGAGGRDGLLGGVDISYEFESIKGSYAAGVYYRYSRSNLDNDMTVLNVRVKQHIPVLDDLYIGAEVVYEFNGKCQNASYCTTIGQDMNENSWHAEVGYQASQVSLKPFLEAGYVSYSKDFTPVATGWSDWGKWYMGNQIDWIIFGSNTKVIQAQGGFWPTPTVKFRMLYTQTRQVENTGTSTGGTLSDEYQVLTEWYPNDWFWINLMLGYAKVGTALAASGLSNTFAFINSGAQRVGSKDSIDVVLATGLRF
jgi:hypothetical protein